MASKARCERVLHSDHFSIGNEETWNGLNVYTSGSEHFGPAVILISDFFGWNTPLLRKLADNVAQAGYLVLVPDLFHGDPFKPSETGSPFSTFPAWVKNHEPPKAIPDCKRIIDSLKSKGIHSIGVAGFCWGAKVAALLAREPCVKAAVLLHPSLVTTDDIKEIRTPVAILAAEIDQSTPPSVVEGFSSILTSRPEIDTFVKIYHGVSHGWAVRYDVTSEKAVAKAQEAHQDMLSWFWKYLK